MSFNTRHGINIWTFDTRRGIFSEERKSGTPRDTHKLQSLSLHQLSKYIETRDRYKNPSTGLVDPAKAVIGHLESWEATPGATRRSRLGDQGLRGSSHLDLQLGSLCVPPVKAMSCTTCKTVCAQAARAGWGICGDGVKQPRQKPPCTVHLKLCEVVYLLLLDRTHLKPDLGEKLSAMESGEFPEMRPVTGSKKTIQFMDPESRRRCELVAFSWKAYNPCLLERSPLQ